MSATGTKTATFTITEARYIGAKVGTDLRILNDLYGKPGVERIDNYVEEVALLLRDGYLATVSYGFRDEASNEWKLRLRYTATAGGYLTDNRPGSFPSNAKIDGYPFYSYLTYSQMFNDLASEKQLAVKSSLPITRSGADEPAARLGSTTTGNTYARNGVGVDRDVFAAF